MAGYQRYSMSNNAADAYESGKMPISKWTKSAILGAIREYLESCNNMAYYEKVKDMQWDRLVCFLKATERHNTSENYNKTTFYALDELFVDSFMNSGEILDHIVRGPKGYVSYCKNSEGYYFTSQPEYAKRMTKYDANIYCSLRNYEKIEVEPCL